jgi:hypothetical protein
MLVMDRTGNTNRKESQKAEDAHSHREIKEDLLEARLMMDFKALAMVFLMLLRF